MTPEYLKDLHFIWPEVVLTVGVLLALFSDLLLKGAYQKITGAVSLFMTALAVYFVGKLWFEGGVHEPFGIMKVDHYALFFKFLTGTGLLVVIVYSIFFRGFNRNGIGEYYAVILSATLGTFFLVSTDNMLLLYLALEMLSLNSYILAGFLKKDMRSSESALKYLVYGTVSSGVMVFGFSLLYGLAGDLSFGSVGACIADGFTEAKGAVIVASVMVLMGFAYKIAAFPFHFWCPDVYEGAPTPVTTFLAVASKAAAFGLLLRFFFMVYIDDNLYRNGLIVEGQNAIRWAPHFATLIGVLSAVTMTYGNITAMKQGNMKRLLAYSSIAHAGYMLMGVTALLTASPATEGASEGMTAILVYLAAYLIMNLGAFGFVVYLANRFGTEEIEGYRGLGWKSPYAAGFMVIFLLSLTGLPPTVGFIGKYWLFLAVIHQGLYWLAVVAALNSVIALFYYFRVAKALFLRNPEDEGEATLEANPRGAFACIFLPVLAILGVATLYYGVYWGTLSELAKNATP